MEEITYASSICFNKTYKGKEVHKYIRIRVILLHTPAKFGRKIWVKWNIGDNILEKYMYWEQITLEDEKLLDNIY